MNRASHNSAARREVILIVEDNRSLRDGLALNLRLHGYRALTAADTASGLRLALEQRTDLIVLDIMLPDGSGLEILQQLREHGEHVPVLILSARGNTPDKVLGLEQGADDYMTKPFDLPELIARIGAMLRRQRTEQETQPVLEVGRLVIDPSARRVRAGGRAVDLSAKEFDLLHLLAAAPGKVFTRDKILQQVWGWDYEGTTRTVDNFVASLRKKIEPLTGRSQYIQTVPRIGYRLDARP